MGLLRADHSGLLFKLAPEFCNERADSRVLGAHFEGNDVG